MFLWLDNNPRDVCDGCPVPRGSDTVAFFSEADVSFLYADLDEVGLALMAQAAVMRARHRCPF